MGIRLRRALWGTLRVLWMAPPCTLLWMMAFPVHRLRQKRAWRGLGEEADRLGLTIHEAAGEPFTGVAIGERAVLDTRDGVSLRALFVRQTSLDLRMGKVHAGETEHFETGLAAFDRLFRHRRGDAADGAALAARPEALDAVVGFYDRRLRFVRRVAIDYYGLRADLHAHVLYTYVPVPRYEELAADLAKAAAAVESALAPGGEPVDPAWFNR